MIHAARFFFSTRIFRKFMAFLPISNDSASKVTSTRKEEIHKAALSLSISHMLEADWIFFVRAFISVGVRPTECVFSYDDSVEI